MNCVPFAFRSIESSLNEACSSRCCVGLLLWSKGVAFYRPYLVLARGGYVCYAGLLLLFCCNVSTDSQVQLNLC